MGIIISITILFLIGIILIILYSESNKYDSINDKGELKLSPPWQVDTNRLKKIFENDNDVIVGDIADCKGGYFVNITVNNASKAVALNKILKKEYLLGNVYLRVSISCPVNEDEMPTFINIPISKVFEAAFVGNPLFVEAKETTTIIGDIETFILFKKEVLQFYSDDISDIYGNSNEVVEDSIKSIISDDIGVFICTVNEND